MAFLGKAVGYEIRRLGVVFNQQEPHFFFSITVGSSAVVARSNSRLPASKLTDR
jgi:hypothetical protein